MGAHGARGELLVFVAAFTGLAFRYWLTVFPRATVHTRRLRRCASRIPDPALRSLALQALAKRGNIEGAAAFAALAVSRHRGELIRALVSFQALYNHLDLLAEQPSADPVAAGRRLHEALVEALNLEHDGEPGASDADEDGGYVSELVDSCSSALRELPSYPQVATRAQSAAERIAAFQSLSLGDAHALKRWARTETPAELRLTWWETAAAGGSSLVVYALIAAAGESSPDEKSIEAIEGTYFPQLGALHSLLDSLIDAEEDRASGQLSLIGCYASRVEARARLGELTAVSLAAARVLPHWRRHYLLVTAMVCNYLSCEEASCPPAATVAQGVREQLGGVAAPMLLMFRVRHLAGSAAAAPRRLAGSCRAVLRMAAVAVGKGKPGANAGAA